MFLVDITEKIKNSNVPMGKKVLMEDYYIYKHQFLKITRNVAGMDSFVAVLK